MEVDYRKRAAGDMKAEAMLTQEQITMMQTEERGEVDVAVTITDGESKEPIFVRAIWAWTPKRKG
jgi:predicted GNAT family acetyltransferase